jgi:hypothetical protein
VLKRFVDETEVDACSTTVEPSACADDVKLDGELGLAGSIVSMESY